MFVTGLAGGVGALLANVQFVLLAPGDTQASIASVITHTLGTPVLPTVIAVTVAAGTIAATLLSRDIHADPAAGKRHFLLFLGGLVAFSAGGSQVGLALGPLLPLLDDGSTAAISFVGILVFGGVGLLIGSWTGAPRMIKALAQDYSSLGPRRSIAALIPSFALAQTAVFFGIPVSFNEIIVSAIIGSGAAGNGQISRDKIGKTLVAWIGSLVLAFGLSYGLFIGINTLL